MFGRCLGGRRLGGGASKSGVGGGWLPAELGGCGRRGIVLVLIKGSGPASNHITESEHDTGRYKKQLRFHVVLVFHHKYSL
jgi:hypothetical protein